METLKTLLETTVYLVASYTDLKGLRIPDWLTLNTISLAITLNTFLWAFSFSSTYPKYSLAGLGIMFLAGILLSCINFWNPGDTKLLMAAGAIKGASYDLFIYAFILILACSCAILFNKLFRNKDVPLAPVFLTTQLTIIISNF